MFPGRLMPFHCARSKFNVHQLTHLLVVFLEDLHQPSASLAANKLLANRFCSYFQSLLSKLPLRLVNFVLHRVEIRIKRSGVFLRSCRTIRFHIPSLRISGALE
jgi:hypothetical protein